MKAKRNSAFINSSVFYLSLSCAISIVLIFAGIFYFLIKGSLPAIHAFGIQFLFNDNWDPVLQKFGAASAIAGTLITSFIALLIAVPISFGITVFTLKIAPFALRKYLRVAIDVLAGIPSIIYGMWGLFALAPILSTYVQPWLNHNTQAIPYIGGMFTGPQIGIGLFTAGLVLGIMIIPFIASIMYDVFELIPDILQESAYALGATTWETIWYVMVPYARSGFIGGIMLGLGRALGETMAVAFVIGNAHTLTTSLFMPSSSVTSVLANEFTEATSELFLAALTELGLCLFILTSVVILLSRILLSFIQKQLNNP
ncbi:Phosphate transport system permease protein PstC [Legionella moravica]|uniref:Phosphate transport system permease protein n=1 Tax=Legionella moravica TaxID=39962 RepID=A0A378K756_9GAMM|nr:phosphate ABC transporter permease subunit PstC [Legionella moravica]KTD38308.1 Phosphate transport system permease protein PstC [Legionella moravica]STX63661.1 Phosphate transport system permease protein pstC [Legionella moravica]